MQQVLVIYGYFYRPPTKLWEVHVFTWVCHSVQGWVSQREEGVDMLKGLSHRGRGVGIWGWVCSGWWVYPRSGIREGEWVPPWYWHLVAATKIRMGSMHPTEMLLFFLVSLLRNCACTRDNTAIGYSAKNLYIYWISVYSYILPVIFIKPHHNFL